MNELFVVEFSLAQKAFHKQTIGEMTKRNLDNILRRVQSDYIPIAIFKTNEEANTYIDITFKHIKDYSIFKNIEGTMVALGN